MQGKNSKPLFAFFGTPELAVVILDELEKIGFMPSLVVTRPDTPKGRGHALTPPPVKAWAEKRGIAVEQPLKIKGEFLENLSKDDWDLFVVAAYGKILPKELLDLPKHGTLNVHPSLLPRLRGPSPIRSAILKDERDVGVSIILLDEEMDHGPIIAQTRVDIPKWPPRAQTLEATLAHEGGKLLADVLPKWAAGAITAQEQDHGGATFCTFLKKEDAEIDLSDDPYNNLLKIRGYEGWPGAFTYFERNGKKIRVSITDAHIENGELMLDRVVPESKREMPYEDLLRSGAKPIVQKHMVD